jgi:hypothetical protein
MKGFFAGEVSSRSPVTYFGKAAWEVYVARWKALGPTPTYGPCYAAS